MKTNLTPFFIFFTSIVCSAQPASIETTSSEVIQKHYDFTSNDTIPYFYDSSSIEQKKFEENYKNKYDTSDFNYDEENKEGLWTLLKQKIEELKRRFYSFLKLGSSQSKTIFVLMRIGSFLIIGLLLYFIIRAVIQKEAYWFLKKKQKKVTTAYDEIEKDLENTNFSKLLSETENKQEYRLAIRYYYLWTLQSLSKKELIVWELEKTNSDYLIEIKEEAVKQDFQYLSYLYNNIWYGEFDINSESFSQAKTSFETFLKKLKYE